MGVLVRRVWELAAPPPVTAPTLTAYSESTQDGLYTAPAAIAVASSFTWASGDVVIAAWGAEDGAYSVTLDNETNLTFTPVSASAGTAASSCEARMYYAVATGAGSGTISGATVAASNHGIQLCAWHFTGSSGIGNTVAAAVTGTTPTQTMTASTDSAVVTAWFDYAATATPFTGETNTGTLTERLENQHTGRYSMWAGDWIGVTSGSDGWGTTDGTGKNLTFAGTVEVLA
jgi:hypothetical protein